MAPILLVVEVSQRCMTFLPGRTKRRVVIWSPYRIHGVTSPLRMIYHLSPYNCCCDLFTLRGPIEMSHTPGNEDIQWRIPSKSESICQKKMGMFHGYVRLQRWQKVMTLVTDVTLLPSRFALANSCRQRGCNGMSYTMVSWR